MGSKNRRFRVPGLQKITDAFRPNSLPPRGWRSGDGVKGTQGLWVMPSLAMFTSHQSTRRKMENAASPSRCFQDPECLVSWQKHRDASRSFSLLAATVGAVLSAATSNITGVSRLSFVDPHEPRGNAIPASRGVTRPQMRKLCLLRGDPAPPGIQLA